MTRRLIDLSHVILPNTGSRPLQAKRRPPVGHADYPKDHWYIMHDVAFVTHTGTHIEVPYHVREEGEDLSAMPLDCFTGEAVILNLTHIPPGAMVSVTDVQAAADAAGGIREGDIVFCRFDYDQYYEHPNPPAPPQFSAEAVAWLVQQGMKLMGVDTGGIELPPADPRAEGQFNHHQLMDRGIPLIENLANLRRLSHSRVTVSAFPVAIQQIESFPVRVVAMEE